MTRCRQDLCMTSFVTRNCGDWRGPSALERASAQVTLTRDGQCCREDRSFNLRVVGSSVLLLRAGDGVGGDRTVGVTASG